MKSFYRNKLKNFGLGTIESLGWSSINHQVARFEALISIGNLSNCTIVDLGCGYGDLKIYLDEHFTGIKYIGVDIMEDYLEYASIKNPTSQFLNLDFLSAPIPSADYIFASGSLNTIQNHNILLKVIDQIIANSRIGSAFNLLSPSELDKKNFVRGYDPLMIIDFLGGLNISFSIKTGYHKDDNTFLIRHMKS